MPPRPAGDICKNALYEIGAFGPADTPSQNDVAFVLDKLTRMCDEWNSRRLAIFARDFLSFTLPTNVQPLTIGQAFQITSVVANGTTAVYTAKNTLKPNDIVDTYNCITSGLNVAGQLVSAATATTFTTQLAVTVTENETNPLCGAVYTGVPLPNFFTYAPRPIEIGSASIVLTTSTPLVKVPIVVHQGQDGAEWWGDVRVPNVLSSVPTDMYYDATFPNGLIYLWPQQSVAYGLELEMLNSLPQYPQATTVFTMPAGYENAITYSLAESIAPAYNKQVSVTLALLARNARAAIFGVNSKAPAQGTKDFGVPSGRGETYFNWKNGSVVGR